MLHYFPLLCIDAPSVKVHPSSSVVVEGHNITLNCVAYGIPEPVLSWTKVGESSQVLSENSSLILSNVRRPGTLDNMLQYQCTAENGVENPAFAIANISVHCKYNSFVNGFCYICTNVYVGCFHDFRYHFCNELCINVFVIKGVSTNIRSLGPTVTSVG